MPATPSPSSERRLGRGLGALLPPAAGLRDVPIDALHPNPWQPRAPLDDAALDDLVASIRQHGVLQPIVVSQQPDGTYQLIAGERRWRSAQRAGLRVVPAIVKEATPRSSLELALVENIQRQDLNAIEEAAAFRQLLDEHGLTQEQLAERIGKSRVAVTNTLRLLQLPAAARQALVEGTIAEGHGRALLIAEGEADRLALLDQVVAYELSVRQTEERARRLAAGGAPKQGQGARTPRADPDEARLIDAFRAALGAKVELKRTRHGGRLVIHFYSPDELQGIYDRLAPPG